MRVARVVWGSVGSLFALTTLFYGTTSVVGLLAFDRTNFRVAFDQAINTIVIDSGAGSVNIEGTERDDVVIEGETLRGLSEPSHEERVVGGELRLHSDCPSFNTGICSVNYDILVPAAVDLVIHSSAGSVRATGLRSALVDVSSSAGSIRLTFVSPPFRVDASTSGGSVTIVLPETSDSYAVDASSSDGGVDTDVRTDPDSERRIDAHSSDGGVTVRYPEPG